MRPNFADLIYLEEIQHLFIPAVTPFPISLSQVRVLHAL